MAETKLDELLGRLQSLQEALESVFDSVYEEISESFQYILEKRTVRFKRKFRELQRQLKTELIKFYLDAEIKHSLHAHVVLDVYQNFVDSAEREAYRKNLVTMRGMVATDNNTKKYA